MQPTAKAKGRQKVCTLPFPLNPTEQHIDATQISIRRCHTFSFCLKMPEFNQPQFERVCIQRRGLIRHHTCVGGQRCVGAFRMIYQICGCKICSNWIHKTAASMCSNISNDLESWKGLVSFDPWRQWFCNSKHESDCSPNLNLVKVT